MKNSLALIALLLLLPCIPVRGESDAAKHHSDGFNTAHEPLMEMRHDGGVKIVFIGNSITLHQPRPTIGWTNSWGMAASSAERDYVHLVVRGIERHEGRAADVRIQNLAEFERHYETYDLSLLDSLVAFAPDYLVVALGENVPDISAEKKYRYYAAFRRLLMRFSGNGRHPKVVVRGAFWRNDEKDFAMSCAAKDACALFVKVDFGADPAMCATGLFAHAGVAAHPGDKGMAEIAKRILETLFKDQAKLKGAKK